MRLLGEEREGIAALQFRRRCQATCCEQKTVPLRLWRESRRFGKDQLYEGLGPRLNSYGFVHRRESRLQFARFVLLEILKLRL
jgi:hypothetical protein